MYVEPHLQNLKKEDQLEELGIDGKIILELILKRTVWTALIWLRWRAPESTVTKLSVP